MNNLKAISEALKKFKNEYSKSLKDQKIFFKIKRCAQCHEIKSKSEFNANTNNLDGYHSYCKDCRKLNAIEKG